MSAEAHEAVAKAIAHESGGPRAHPSERGYALAAAALDALRPFIAAEIRAWVGSERNEFGTLDGAILALIEDADKIAARIVDTEAREDK